MKQSSQNENLIKIVKIYLKMCSSSLAIRKTQTNPALRFHLTPDRMVKIKKTADNKCQ